MKKILVIICMMMLSVLGSGCTGQTNDKKEPQVYFGTGRFILLVETAEDETGMQEKKYILWDQTAEPGNQIVEQNLEAYWVKRPYAYCIGEHYTKLDYSKEVWQQGESPEDFSEEDQEIFAFIAQRIEDHYQERRFKKWYRYPRIFD